jgi:hypothetical protein
VHEPIALRRLRLHPVRSAFDIAALAAVLALSVRLVLGSGAAPDQWKIYPGPVPVSQRTATACFEGSPAVSAVRPVGAVDLVRFAGQRGFVKLEFLAGEDAAIQAAYADKIPWVINNTIWSHVPSRTVLEHDTDKLDACLNMAHVR